MGTKSNPSLMKRRPFSDQNLDLPRLISVTRDAVRKAGQKELDRYKVNARRAALLLAVQSLGDNATPVAIGQQLLRERHSVSELLSKMEKAGLITEIRDLDRRNRVRVVLTPKGSEVCRKSIVRESIHKIISSLSRDEINQLRLLLQRLRDKTLQELGIERPVPRLPNAKQDIELYALLIEATDAIRKARQKELNEHNIDMAWSGILLTIGALGDRATPVAIGQWLLRERHSVSELLSKMEKAGLLTKVRDLERKNRVRVVLTSKGNKVYHQSSTGKIVPRIISSLSKEERQQLKLHLHTLKNEALKALGKRYPSELV